MILGRGLKRLMERIVNLKKTGARGGRGDAAPLD